MITLYVAGNVTVVTLGASSHSTRHVSHCVTSIVEGAEIYFSRVLIIIQNQRRSDNCSVKIVLWGKMEINPAGRVSWQTSDWRWLNPTCWGLQASWLFPLWSRYTMAAQDLVMRARGALRDRGWRITNERLGSGDDISAFIIPLMYGNRQPWGARLRWPTGLMWNENPRSVFLVCYLHIFLLRLTMS